MPSKYAIFACLAGLFCLAVFLFFIPLVDGKTYVYFLDVGQGDAIFIRTGQGKQILIDGGPDRSVLSRLGEVMPFYDRTLDMVALTHTDTDHLTGLIEVLKNYKVKNILETGAVCQTSLCQEWERVKKEEGAEIHIGQLGEEVRLDNRTKFLVLYPFDDLMEQKVASTNNRSLVLKLLVVSLSNPLAGEQSVLLTGDNEELVEEKMSLADINLDADFLKIAHHGSAASTTENFLKAVTPLAAFISVGADNRYGHPAPEVLSRLEKDAVPYYRTDRQGTIELVLDGENYFVK